MVIVVDGASYHSVLDKAAIISSRKCEIINWLQKNIFQDPVCTRNEIVTLVYMVKP
jgi:hypothetical protein